VEDDPPALAVDADVMVILAQRYAVTDRGFTVILFVPDVVHVAVNRGAAASGPGALPVAQEDGAADVPGDGVAVADVDFPD
jgi:hypothetical protein